MARKKIVKQLDGRLDEAKREIDVLPPVHGYRTSEASVYEESLKEMNLSDLHGEAIDRGVIPNTDDRNRLISRLMTVFRQKVMESRGVAQPTDVFTLEQRKKAAELLSS